MEDLKRMAIFAAVVDNNGFTRAAKKLMMTTSAVSKQVSQLEDRLGVRLLHRTTRKIQLTEPGRLFHERCARIVAMAAEAEELVADLQKEPAGALRISVPINLGESHVARAVGEFMKLYERIAVELVLEDRHVNLANDGFDAALRVGIPEDSSLVARKLATTPMLICASPAYLAERGRPRTPRDLAKHEWILYTMTSDAHVRTFRKGRRRETVRLSGRARANNGAAVVELLLAGVGLVAAPAFYLKHHLREGRLVEILPGWELPGLDIYLLHQKDRHALPKLRAFSDFLVERFGDEDWDVRGA